MAEGMFGPYRLEGLIGRGGMGEVHRAFDTVRKRTVALKRLAPTLAADPIFQARFRKESALAAQLNEPHILPIHDYGEIDGQLYLDMRLVDGPDLAAYLEEFGPLSPARAANVVNQLAAALDAAHDAGLVHRDIKPANVLLARTGNSRDELGDFVYVADFGIAHSISASTTSLTVAGAAVGSLHYMAPERFTDDHGDHRVDVYSLGCLLYEGLTAHKPFPSEGLPALIHSHLNMPPPRTAQRLGVSVCVDEVIARAMAKHPDQRYQSAGALAAAFRSALSGGHAADARAVSALPRHEQETLVPVARHISPPPQTKRTIPLRPAGKLFALIGFALAVLLLGAAILSETGTADPHPVTPPNNAVSQRGTILYSTYGRSSPNPSSSVYGWYSQGQTAGVACRSPSSDWVRLSSGVGRDSPGFGLPGGSFLPASSLGGIDSATLPACR